MFSSLDIDADVEAVQILGAGAFTTEQLGSAIDLANYRKVLIVINYGTITDGTILPTVTSSDASGGSYTAETNTTTITAGTAAADEVTTVFSIDPKKAKQFVKVNLTESVASAGWDASATLIGFKKAS